MVACEANVSGAPVMRVAVCRNAGSAAVAQVIGTLTEAAAADLGLPTTVVVAPGLCLHSRAAVANR